MAGTASFDYGSQQQKPEAESAAAGYDPNYVPDSVRSFVVHIYRHIREKNVYEIHQMYETSFQSISDRFFKDSPWPSVDAVAPYVDNDHVFCLLYREMWFRHLYARHSPTLKQRIDSWDNYCSLFQVVLHGVVNMQLPNQWLWDMVDEFVYQFQSFCQYRAKMKSKTEQEIALLRQYDQAWNVYGVLNFLQALVEKSTIIQILEQEKEGLVQFTATDGYDYNGGSNVLKVLGYFSMIGLLRVHCLLGDYHTGLKCLLPIDISQQGVYFSVIGSHITTIYHYGFASLMLRRYVALFFDHQLPGFWKFSSMTTSLIAVALLCNINFPKASGILSSEARIPRERNPNFTFIPYFGLNNTKHCSHDQTLVYWPLYRTILMTYKHKTHAVDSDGKITSNADVNFYIDDDMIRVIESKPAKRYGDYFLRQIVKLEGVMSDVDRIKLE
ncbi:eukaryotic translation initiation factor 3 subunit L-like [Olea europaea var. sylvestris]|uniref:eukaryotic translation initiation factor 3 subunit L-like n=1 Tax=Olea europaea var. sylvestris TaxID=158386 RepID=UPI000C1D36B8|nr:eukaryotic translation initiation factor 3 subunit L-like [Olea europaea var. sylvestris]